MEIWKDVVGYEGKYMCSNYGNLKSLDSYVRVKHYKRICKGQMLKLSINNLGYKRTLLSINGIRKMHLFNWTEGRKG